jgi:hypothetical protein
MTFANIPYDDIVSAKYITLQVVLLTELEQDPKFQAHKTPRMCSQGNVPDPPAWLNVLIKQLQPLTKCSCLAHPG